MITGGAEGTGDLDGTATVVNVLTTKKAFVVGQTISGEDIAAGTKIAAVGAGTITLSQAATGTKLGDVLSVAEGPGNIATTNEREIITLGNNPGDGYKLKFITADPSPGSETTGVISIDAPASGAGSVAEALEGLSNIGKHNVSVEGTPGGPYTVEFKGSRFVDTNVVQLGAGGSGEVRVETEQNGHSAAEICTAAIAASCAGGVEGDGDGEFAWKSSVRVAVGPAGAVYVADSVVIGNQEDSNYEDSLQKFDSSGVFGEALSLPQSKRAVVGFAVESSGDFFVSVTNVHGELRKYDSSGKLLETVPGVGGALAVDPGNDLFVDHFGKYPSIAEYESAGNELRSFGYGASQSQASASGLAPYHTANGEIYGSQVYPSSYVTYLSFPPAGPLVFSRPCEANPIGNTKATLDAELNPEGEETHYHFEYIGDADFQADQPNGFEHAIRVPAQASEDPRLSGDEAELFELRGVSVQATQLMPETGYHCRVVADSGAGTATGEEGEFETKPPLAIGLQWASEVGFETATLNVEVDPFETAAAGFFEYVDQEHFEKEGGFASSFTRRTPDVEHGEAPLDLGAGDGFSAVTVPVSGLSPATFYRYRLLATDSLFAPDMEQKVKALRGLVLSGSGVGWRASRGSDGGSD